LHAESSPSSKVDHIERFAFEHKMQVEVDSVLIGATTAGLLSHITYKNFEPSLRCELPNFLKSMRAILTDPFPSSRKFFAVCAVLQAALIVYVFRERSNRFIYFTLLGDLTYFLSLG
jgi:hypothetical protein